MPNDTRTDAAPVLLAWGTPSNDTSDGALDLMAVWLTGGLSLLLWTALALVLTA